jgi:OmpA family protein/uncharacterized protein DUF6089
MEVWCMSKHSSLRRLMSIGSLALIMFAGAGAARGAEQATAEPSATPVCKNAGVTISFIAGSAEVDRNGLGALAGVATWLQNGDQRTVRLEGYADKQGGATGNQRLSERRAHAAKEFLVGRGIEPARIMTFGHGEQEDRTGPDARVVAVTACDFPKQAVAAQNPAEEEAGAAVEPEAAPGAEIPEPVPPAKPPVTVLPPPPAPTSDVPRTAMGMEATIGGGAIGFINDAARAAAGTGGSWEARLMFGSRLPLAVETAYVGSAQSIDMLGMTGDTFLVGNGIEGTLRVNLSLGRIQPYVFGGAGYTRYHIANVATNTASVRENDDIGTVPLGGGVSVRLGRAFIVDVRGTYRATFNDDLFSGITAANNALQTWNVGGRVGFEF